MLTARQEEIRDHLLQVGGPRPSVDREMVLGLSRQLQEGVTQRSAPMSPGSDLWVNKSKISWAIQCQGLVTAHRKSQFEWSAPTAKGKVAHRAMEWIVLASRQRPPLELARDAIDELAGSQDAPTLAEFLRDMSLSERHELLREVSDMVTKVITDWPPMQAHWFPRVETPSRRRIGQITLSANFDLTFGRPRADEAGVIIIDFKTGNERYDHRQDLHFYALMETLCRGIPPFRVATYYLDSGTWNADDVNEGLLQSAVIRVLDALDVLVPVECGRVPTLSPGSHCRYCPDRSDCKPGSEWSLAHRSPTHAEDGLF